MKARTSSGRWKTSITLSISSAVSRADMKRILLVEDESVIANVVEDALRLEGLEVEIVSNGLTASDRALNTDFDLILLAGMLPGKDGFELCRELRRAGRKPPVILLTARAQVADRVRGLDL